MTISATVTSQFATSSGGASRSRFLPLGPAIHDGLHRVVGDDQHRFPCALELTDHRVEAHDNVLVRLAPRIAVGELVAPARRVLFGPSIVFGPRDRWVTSMAEAILARSAYVVRGEGICNTVYVDNLVHAIRLAMTADADGEVFLITDRESITWSALYRRVSEALGNHWTVPVIEDPAVIRERRPLLAKLKEFAPVGAAVPFIPRGWKLAARDAINVASAALSAAKSAVRQQAVNPWQLPATPTPAVPLSIALLHRCRHRFPYAKAKDRMGYEPLLSLDEGLERTLAWMRFVAYPVGPRSITDPGRAVR